jgi:glutaconate CoA-transferase, subunit B
VIIIRQSQRAFVEKLDFITSAGHLEGGDSRRRAGLPGKGPTAVITDLCVLEPDPVTRELTVTSIHPGVERAQIDAATGWPLRYAAQVAMTPEPSGGALQVLRDLLERTARAHGAADSE